MSLGFVDKWMLRHCKTDWSAKGHGYEIAEQIQHRKEIAKRFNEGYSSSDLGILASDIIEALDRADCSYQVLDKSFRGSDCIRYENPKEDTVLFVDRDTKEAQCLVHRHG